MTASFKSKGTFASGAAGVTPGLPASVGDGDLMLLFVESANQAASAPSGWTAIPTPSGNHFRGTAGAAGGVRVDIFYRFWQSGDAAPTVADTGDHTTAIICAYCGVDPTTPFDGVTPIGFNAAASTTLTMDGITTGTADALVVHGVARDVDAASTNGVTGALTNANLTRLAEEHDQTVTTGTGGGLFIGHGLKASAGATGNSTATQTSSAWGGITLCLRARTAPTYTIKGTDNAEATQTSMTVASFSNVSGRMLVALVTGVIDNGSLGDLTISDTQGLTWTLQVSAALGDWSAQAYIWTATANGSDTAVTVTEGGTGTLQGGFMAVLEVTNGGIGTNGSGTFDQTLDGTRTFDLAAAPAADSLIVSCTCVDSGELGSAGTILAGLGLETIAEQYTTQTPDVFITAEVAERVGGGATIQWNYAGTPAQMFAKAGAALEITYSPAVAKAPPPRAFNWAPHMVIR